MGWVGLNLSVNLISWSKSCKIFLLRHCLFCQFLLDSGPERSRWLHWKFSLTAMLFNVVCLLPYYQLYLATKTLSSKQNVPSSCLWGLYYYWPLMFFFFQILPKLTDWSPQQRLLVTTLAWCIFFYLFWKVGDTFPIQNKDSGHCK